eukprot:jgi/Chrzof1/4279/Cz14g06040.t1
MLLRTVIMHYDCLSPPCYQYHTCGEAAFVLLLLQGVRVEPEIFRSNGVYRLIYYYCGSSSDCGGVVAMEFS